MAEDSLQFSTKATASALLPLLKSRITLLLSSHVLQKVTCTLPKTWWCCCTVLHSLPTCPWAARAQPTLTAPPRAWVFTAPWQNEDGGAARCYRSVLGYRRFGEVSVLKLPSEMEGAGHCLGVNESSHTVVHRQEHWLQHTQTHTVWLLTRCNTATPASMQEKRSQIL